MYFSESKTATQFEVDWKPTAYAASDALQGGEVAVINDYFLKDDSYNRFYDQNTLFAESHSLYAPGGGDYANKIDSYIPFYATEAGYGPDAGKNSTNSHDLVASSNAVPMFSDTMYAGDIGINPTALNYNYQYFDAQNSFARNGTRKSFTYGAYHDAASEGPFIAHSNASNAIIGADDGSDGRVPYANAAIDSKNFYIQEGKRRKSIAVPDEYRSRSTMRHLDSEKRRRAAINELYAQLESKVRHMIDGKVSKARILHVTANTIEYYKKALGDA